jgi:hypothetical protein
MARERDASIDELLGDAADGEPEARHERPRRGSGLLRVALIAAAVAGAAYVVSLPVGLKIPYILLFAVFFALLALRRAVRVVEAPRMPTGAEPPSTVAAHVDPTRVADGLQLALDRWDSRLASAERDPQRFMSVVRPRLADIADERLRQRHGLRRAEDPWRARELMGERLWTFLFSPTAGAPNRAELAAVVDDMEKL